MKKTAKLTITLIWGFMLMTTSIYAQEEKEYNVAIYLYSGVELLDFSGPGEVFGATNGFNVYTVSTDGQPILSQGFVTVNPEYAIKTAPKPDIVIFPGGGTGPTSRNPEVLNWIKKLADTGTITMSVCTGANILAKAGLLDGLNVTTWHGFTDRLQEMLPSATVHKNTRFVDSGNVITTAGVSAGIDGALHMVARIKGRDVAESTAHYMEYDKWQPEEGRIDYKNPLIEAIRTEGTDRALELIAIDFHSGTPSFYEGEMKNLGLEYVEQENWKKAEEIFELVVQYYPRSISSYDALSTIYEKQEKYAPAKEKVFIDMVLEGDIDEAIAQFRDARNHYPQWIMFRESYVNYAGYQYLQKDQLEEAITLFKLNTEVYPESANVYDSLGEAYLKAGKKEQAVKNYAKALKIDPELVSAREALARLEQEKE